MKNKELQELLAKYPDDTEIYVADWQEGYLAPTNYITVHPPGTYVWDRAAVVGIVLE